MQIASNGDNLHEMPNPVFWGKKCSICSLPLKAYHARKEFSGRHLKKIRFDTSYKFSPKENNLYEMVKTLFSGENMKNIVSMSSAELGQRVVKVNKKQRAGILELPSNMIGHRAIIVVVVRIFNATRHRGSGDCYDVHVFVQPCFPGSSMHTWCRCLSPSAALSFIFNTGHVEYELGVIMV